VDGIESQEEIFEEKRKRQGFANCEILPDSLQQSYANCTTLFQCFAEDIQAFFNPVKE
jgi:hypothetical protein